VIARRLETADPLALYLSMREARGAFILEIGGRAYLGAAPKTVVRYAAGRLQVDASVTVTDDPVAHLREILATVPPAGGPGFRGGFVGYFGYGFVRCLEDVPSRHPASPFPEVELGLFEDWVEVAGGAATYHSLGEARAPEAVADVRPEATLDAAVPDMTREGFEEAVTEAKQEIRRGEIFQAVLSREETRAYRGDLAGYYATLRRVSPSPYQFLIQFGDRTIAGASPETLVRVEGDRITTFPIAGTRPRGETPGEQARLAAELVADEKERAEHNMLVDLARNDVGRVAAVGSVSVPEYLQVKAFSHVQHLVSRVTGRLAAGKDPWDAFGSVFPAGTVSGAPKVRAMEIIDRLEASARGPYAGAVGYVSRNGGLDTAITIRTLYAEGGRVHLRAGAGIVADSVPSMEYEETEHKLVALRAAARREVAA
jgi:anthranilate synthase component 1